MQINRINKKVLNLILLAAIDHAEGQVEKAMAGLELAAESPDFETTLSALTDLPDNGASEGDGDGVDQFQEASVDDGEEESGPEASAEENDPSSDLTGMEGLLDVIPDDTMDVTDSEEEETASLVQAAKDSVTDNAAETSPEGKLPETPESKPGNGVNGEGTAVGDSHKFGGDDPASETSGIKQILNKEQARAQTRAANLAALEALGADE